MSGPVRIQEQNRTKASANADEKRLLRYFQELLIHAHGAAHFGRRTAAHDHGKAPPPSHGPRRPRRVSVYVLRRAGATTPFLLEGGRRCRLAVPRGRKNSVFILRLAARNRTREGHHRGDRLSARSPWSVAVRQRIPLSGQRVGLGRHASRALARPSADLGSARPPGTA